jgi:hypothetical protein
LCGATVAAVSVTVSGTLVDVVVLASETGVVEAVGGASVGGGLCAATTTGERARATALATSSTLLAEPIRRIRPA